MGFSAFVLNPINPIRTADEVRVDRRQNNFDLLRLFAAWFVLFAHCYPLGGINSADPLTQLIKIENFGGLGVGIFFVLSGYLVTQSLQRSKNLFEFSKRRVARIFPALIALIVLCIFVLGPALTTLPLKEYFVHPLTLDYARNISAWSIRFPLPGVFADVPHANAVNGSLWTLPYEVRSYLVLAIISLLPLSIRPKIAVMMVACFTALCFWPPIPPMSPYALIYGADYYTMKLGIYFGVGAFAATFTSIRAGWLLVCSSAVAIGSLILIQTSHTQMAVFSAAVAVLTLSLGLLPNTLPKLPAAMGDWSYGLYLYGFPVQQLLASYGYHLQGIVPFVAYSTFLSVACAAISWFVVEQPALRWSRRSKVFFK
jgi:peptidoglycan/LPS O-acetylase OafA/YrhL